MQAVGAEEGDENNTKVMSPKRPADAHQWPRRAIHRDLSNPHTVIMPWRLSEAWQWGSGVGVEEGGSTVINCSRARQYFIHPRAALAPNAIQTTHTPKRMSGKASDGGRRSIHHTGQ